MDNSTVSVDFKLRIIAPYPENSTASFKRGVLNWQQGQIEDAIADFDAAIESNPEDADAYYNRGIIKQALVELNAPVGIIAEHSDVTADFDAAIEHNPEHVHAYFAKGCVNVKAGFLVAAAECFLIALRLVEKTGTPSFKDEIEASLGDMPKSVIEHAEDSPWVRGEL